MRKSGHHEWPSSPSAAERAGRPPKRSSTNWKYSPSASFPEKTKNGLVPYPAAIDSSGAFCPSAPLMQSKSRVWTLSRFESGAGKLGFSSEPSGSVTSKTS